MEILFKSFPPICSFLPPSCWESLVLETTQRQSSKPSGPQGSAAAVTLKTQPSSPVKPGGARPPCAQPLWVSKHYRCFFEVGSATNFRKKKNQPNFPGGQGQKVGDAWVGWTDVCCRQDITAALCKAGQSPSRCAAVGSWLLMRLGLSELQLQISPLVNPLEPRQG